MKRAEPIVQQNNQIGEGALWHAPRQCLYWVDILGQKVFIYNPKTGQSRAIDVGSDVGTIVARASGGAMLAIKEGFASLDFDTGKVEVIKMVEVDKPNNRLNDGKCDPAGRFWAGSMAYDCARGAGSLYCLEPDLRVRKVLSDLTIPNGLVWTKDQNAFYYIDSIMYQIAEFDYDNSAGTITNRRVLVEVSREDGILDGMAIDDNDNLWVAMYGTGKVCCWDHATGKLLDKIEVPGAKLTTSCAFGGPNMNELYITSASHGLTPAERREQPLAGALFKAELDVTGVFTFEFAG